jgi:glycine/D-amino acid oxidase-like deaminating enzyme
MKLSYWEEQAWFTQVDFTLVGAGLVGLNAALRLRELYPDKHILVVERGPLPSGASTRNAGFACFGSLSELLADAESHSAEELRNLVEKRYQGIQFLRTLLGDSALHYAKNGGHELFLERDRQLFEACEAQMQETNALLYSVFGGEAFSLEPSANHFKGVLPYQFSHAYEGELHPGFMMQALLKKVQKAGITVLTGVDVKGFEETGSAVQVFTSGRSWKTDRLLIATNGFAAQLLGKKATVLPARAQVILSSPVKSIIKGCYHLDRGYYYFRQIEGRILLGGGRHLDIEGETSIEAQTTALIQDRLEELLREVIFPGEQFEVEHRWTGVMGVGNQKKPVLKALSDRVYCGVRLGGMGVALGSLVGKELADLTVL